MQYLKITNNTTLSSLSTVVGKKNVDSVLATNGLSRTRNVGQAFTALCKSAISTATKVSTSAKIGMLNTLTSDSEVFEEAALLSDSNWKIMSKVGTLPGTLKMPDGVTIRDSSSVIGGKSGSVSTLVYKSTISSLKSTGRVNPAIFNTYSSSKLGAKSSRKASDATNNTFIGFNLPWGKIQIASSLSSTVMDFPVYPEDYDTSRVANYSTMTDTIYQYEPWYTYSSSGPRTQELTFKFHRDMWTGDHTDGKAEELIKFCEANCFPLYSGSAVIPPTVSIYINGELFISGIMTQVDTHREGPLGHDGWPLYVELTLNITEVAPSPLSYSSIRNATTIGGY